MPGRDIIVVGASAGGVEALTALARQLPADLPAAVFVVLHVPSNGTSVLPRLLNRRGSLPAAHARHGEPIQHGRIYVAPPDCHLLIRRGIVRVVRGPKENRHRPAVDPLFRTAALAYHRRVIGVVMSGVLDDGTAGLLAVKMRGGLAIVQDPGEALYSGMPRNAIENVEVDYILPLGEIGPTLEKLVREPVEEEGADAVADEMEYEADIVAADLQAIEEQDRPGAPSGFACPECGGVLWELHEGEYVRFRCRVGHAFSVDSLLAEQGEGLEAALWSALRALEERAALMRRMSARARANNHTLTAKRYEEAANETEERAAVIRDVLLAVPPPAEPETTGEPEGKAESRVDAPGPGNRSMKRAGHDPD